MVKATSLSTLARQLRSVLARHLDASQIRRELETSSDRALADMGLCRGEIAAVAKGRFAGR